MTGVLSPRLSRVKSPCIPLLSASHSASRSQSSSGRRRPESRAAHRPTASDAARIHIEMRCTMPRLEDLRLEGRTRNSRDGRTGSRAALSHTPTPTCVHVAGSPSSASTPPRPARSVLSSVAVLSPLPAIPSIIIDSFLDLEVDHTLLPHSPPPRADVPRPSPSYPLQFIARTRYGRARM
ncbi:hypothetical protein B0H11DRAFT_2140028 [Mycena galericulata]|nr:hypothetical protein B0H11DRAFT_2140028 [Mycena galericulata]